jgi:hypothetical protein
MQIYTISSFVFISSLNYVKFKLLNYKSHFYAFLLKICNFTTNITLMNKIIPFFFLLLSFNIAKAGAGTFGTDAARIGLEDNLSNNAFYKFSPPASNGDANFNSALLSGTTSTLKITSLYCKTYENGGDVVTGVNFFYRIYPTGSPSGSFISYGLTNLTNIGGNDKMWSRPAGASNDIQLVFGLNPSTSYTLECYFVYNVNTFTGALVVAGTGNYNNNSGNINQSAPTLPLPAAQTFKATFNTATTLNLNNIDNFAVQYYQSKVNVKWDLATSNGLSALKLQRSSNGVNWETLGTYNIINAAPGTFNYVDNQPMPGLSLYKIVGIGLNGNEVSSRILRMNIATIDNSLQVFPVPTVSFIDVLMNGIKKGDYKAFIYSNDGKRILLAAFNHDGLTPQRRFNIPAHVQSGTYFLMIQNNKEFYKQQIIKK